jgi:hypothetical protein
MSYGGTHASRSSTPASAARSRHVNFGSGMLAESAGATPCCARSTSRICASRPLTVATAIALSSVVVGASQRFAALLRAVRRLGAWTVGLGFGGAFFFFATDPAVEFVRRLAGYGLGRVPTHAKVLTVLIVLSVALSVGGLCGVGFERLPADARTRWPAVRVLAIAARIALFSAALALLSHVAMLWSDARFRRSYAVIEGRWVGDYTSIAITAEGKCELFACGRASSCELEIDPPESPVVFKFEEPRWRLSGSCIDNYHNLFAAHGGWTPDGKLELWAGTIRHGSDMMASGLQVLIRSDPHMFDIRQAADKHGTAGSY